MNARKKYDELMEDGKLNTPLNTKSWNRIYTEFELASGESNDSLTFLDWMMKNFNIPTRKL